MKYSTNVGGLVSSLLAVAFFGVGCSDDGEPSTAAPPLMGAGGTPAEEETTPPGAAGVPASSPEEQRPDLVLDAQEAAHGWASVWSDGARVTNGGANADADHIYTVTNRTELVRALYPDAIIADDGTFTSANRADPTPKIIYVQGRISLSTNAAGEELTLEDYACEGYDFEAYKAAYDPKVWNQQPLVDDAPPEILPCPGSQEELRRCSVRRQRAVVEIRVGSNTSIIGLGTDAKIVHGGIVIGGTVPSGAPPAMGPAPLDPELAEACGIELPPEPEPEPTEEPATPAPAPPPPPALVPTAENVIVRNITFEDAFDFFPAWDPTDSYSAPPEVADPEGLYPLCQATYDAANDAGPHQCRGGRWNSEYDTLRIQNATHVWVDHSTFNDGDRETQSTPSIWQAPYDEYAIRVQPHDAALDVVGFSDFVTVSHSVFQNHDKVMLIGGSDTVRDTNGWGALSVTLHDNRFVNCGQRLPRVRFGKVHVYSNYIEGSLSPEIGSAEDRVNKPLPAYPMGSALTVGHLAKVYSENNVYEIEGYPGDPEPTAADIAQPSHRATPTEGDTPDVNQQTYFFDTGSLLNGQAVDLMASVQEQAAEDEDPEILSTDSIWKPSDTYTYTPTPAADVKSLLATTAGAGKLTVSAPE
jgi:pectate lyase